MPSSETLLLLIQVPLRKNPEGTLLLEAQAANGLRLWAQNFARVIVILPFSPSADDTGHVPVSALGAAADRIEFVLLPHVSRPGAFLRALPSARRRIREKMDEAQWLCFAIGGLFGDWGAVAALEAHRAGRRFSVWTDRVESEVTRVRPSPGSVWAAGRTRLLSRLMALQERFVIRRAALGLFHGRETFDAYAPFSRQPALVHNIHLGKADQIPETELIEKERKALTEPLRIFYAGRMEPMKGPQDWLHVLRSLCDRNIAFQAEWIGDGSLMPEFTRCLRDFGLQNHVSAPGNIFDRVSVLRRYREANIFLFCHLTPESPRCLIEALKSGTPIIGYDSSFPRDLISTNGGGRLTPRGDTDALAASLIALHEDRKHLSRLVRAAAMDGAPYDDETVFAHRAHLIKTYA